MSWNAANKYRAPKIPKYGKDEARVIPGLYLGLFHGYTSEAAREKHGGEWGADGPLIGPLVFLHTTYGSHMKPQFRADADVALYEGLWPANCLWNNPLRDKGIVTDGSIYLVGSERNLFPAGDMQYGDWTVVNVGPEGVIVK